MTVTNVINTETKQSTENPVEKGNTGKINSRSVTKAATEKSKAKWLIIAQIIVMALAMSLIISGVALCATALPLVGSILTTIGGTLLCADIIMSLFVARIHSKNSKELEVVHYELPHPTEQQKELMNELTHTLDGRKRSASF